MFCGFQGPSQGYCVVMVRSLNACTTTCLPAATCVLPACAELQSTCPAGASQVQHVNEHVSSVSVSSCRLAMPCLVRPAGPAAISAGWFLSIRLCAGLLALLLLLSAYMRPRTPCGSPSCGSNLCGAPPNMPPQALGVCRALHVLSNTVWLPVLHA